MEISLSTQRHQPDAGHVGRSDGTSATRHLDHLPFAVGGHNQSRGYFYRSGTTEDATLLREVLRVLLYSSSNTHTDTRKATDGVQKNE